MEITPLDTITTIDCSNAINEDDITEEDNTTIYNNLMTELSKSKLFSLIIDIYESFMNDNYYDESVM